jgi:hypothetical protein
MTLPQSPPTSPLCQPRSVSVGHHARSRPAEDVPILCAAAGGGRRQGGGCPLGLDYGIMWPVFFGAGGGHERDFGGASWIVFDCVLAF